MAGVGNVYRAESLFRARLSPMTPGVKVSKRKWNALWDDLVDLMAYGVGTGRIDTVRPEHEPEAMGRDPRRDDHGGEVYVYRRHGQPCHVCGTHGQDQGARRPQSVLVPDLSAAPMTRSRHRACSEIRRCAADRTLGTTRVDRG